MSGATSFLTSACVAVFLLLLGLVGLAASPLVLLFALVRHLLFMSPSFYRQPQTLRVAVIGGGWAGLQTTARLAELGVTDIRCFDEKDDIGGTWHPRNTYKNLRLHSPIWSCAFDRFPFLPGGTGTSRSSNLAPGEHDARVTGVEVINYLRAFVDHTHTAGSQAGIRRFISCNSKVLGIDARARVGGAADAVRGAGPGALAEGSSHATVAHLSVRDSKSGAVREEGPFDLVLFASLTGKPVVPLLPGLDTYRGVHMHSSGLHAVRFQELGLGTPAGSGAPPKMVVVVGASKSAADVCLNITNAGHPRERLIWLQRRPYAFFKFERAFHRRTLLESARALIVGIAWIVSAFAPNLGWLVMCVVGCTWAVSGYPIWSTFHFGMLDSTERHDLAHRVDSVFGDPVACNPDGLVLADGTKIACDVIVFATR
jgi:hypothetical protein